MQFLDEIEDRGSGWFRQLISTRSPRTGTRRVWSVEWRSETVECCGRELGEQTGDDAPVIDFDPQDDGGLTEWHWQCGNCGSLNFGTVTIYKID